MIKEDTFRVLVKANASKNEFLGYNEARKAYKVAIKEPAEENKANRELVKFLSKELGNKVRIVLGHASKIKTLAKEQQYI
jgi:uncharacterized protein (TIGR00251 family)